MLSAVSSGSVGYWDLGEKYKSNKVSAERARRMLIDSVISNDWEERMLVTVSRIKVFFGNSRAEMETYIKKIEEQEVSTMIERNVLDAVHVSDESGEQSVRTNECLNVRDEKIMRIEAIENDVLQVLRNRFLSATSLELLEKELKNDEFVMCQMLLGLNGQN